MQVVQKKWYRGASAEVIVQVQRCRGSADEVIEQVIVQEQRFCRSAADVLRLRFCRSGSAEHVQRCIVGAEVVKR